MVFTKTQWALLAVNSGYVCWFGFQYVTALNYEFIAYAGLVVSIFAILYATLHLTRFPTYIIACLTLWGLLHMMGGSVQTADGVLYAYKIYPFFDAGNELFILKFDQAVHAFLYGVVGLMFLHLLREYLQVRRPHMLVAIIAIMAAVGVSALNEIIEFVATLALPDTGVGGYENTMLDIIFNLGGAVVGVTGFYVVQKLKRWR